MEPGEAESANRSGSDAGYLDQRNFRFNGSLYPTYADFLLGLNGFQNGTASVVAPFSNILVAIDFLGLSDRDERTWNGFGYVQDDIKVNRRFTVNLGLRYERIGELGDIGGRNGNFDPRSRIRIRRWAERSRATRCHQTSRD